MDQVWGAAPALGPELIICFLLSQGPLDLPCKDIHQTMNARLPTGLTPHGAGRWSILSSRGIRSKEQGFDSGAFCSPTPCLVLWMDEPEEELRLDLGPSLN